MDASWLEALPTTWIYVGVALLMIVSCEGGYRLGGYLRTRHDKEAPASLGPVVGGLLAMLAFVLAFTFSMAAAQHEQRKQNVVAEANAVGTAYLRADLLDEPTRGVMKDLLREYVDVRLDATADLTRLPAALERSVQIHDELWSRVAAATRAAPTLSASLVIQALNQVIDMHQQRVCAGLYNRIPSSVWIAMFAISALTMVTIGLQISLPGKRRLAAVVPLSLAFAVLVTLVVDLDHPAKGLVTVSQQAMVDVQRGMEGADG